MTDHLFRRGNVWHGWLYVSGRRVQASTHCTDRKAARAALASLERQTLAGPGAKPGTVREALGLLERPGVPEGTLSMYRVKAFHLRRLLGSQPLTAIVAAPYTATRTSEGAAMETVRKELVVLRTAVRLAREAGYATADPDSIPVPVVRSVPRSRWLTRAEVAELLLAHPDRRLWLLCAVYLGPRLSELHGLRWEDFDWATGTVHIRGTKTASADRHVPIPSNLLPELQAVRRESGPVLAPWLNVHRDLAGASPNDLRRTFASWLKQAGVDSFTVARLLGHSSSRTVERVYGHLSADSLRAAVEMLAPSRAAEATG